MWSFSEFPWKGSTAPELDWERELGIHAQLGQALVPRWRNLELRLGGSVPGKGWRLGAQGMQLLGPAGAPLKSRLPPDARLRNWPRDLTPTLPSHSRARNSGPDARWPFSILSLSFLICQIGIKGSLS